MWPQPGSKAQRHLQAATRALTALARALHVTRPRESAGIRPRTRAFSLSRSCGRHRVERRADAARDRARRPVVLERRERALHHDLARLDRLKSRSRPQPAKRFHFTGRWIGRKQRGDARRAGFLPDRLERKAAAEYVPRICANQSAGPDHAGHFGCALHRIGDEEDDQRHDGRIEALRLERQRHGIGLTKRHVVRARPHAGDGELSLAGIDALHLGRSTSLGDQLGKRAGSASDVEPLQAGTGRQPLEERLPRKAAPGAHATIVGVAVLEANALHARHHRHSMRSAHVPAKWIPVRRQEHAPLMILRLDARGLRQRRVGSDLLDDERVELGGRHEHRIDAERRELGSSRRALPAL